MSYVIYIEYTLYFDLIWDCRIINSPILQPFSNLSIHDRCMIIISDYSQMCNIIRSAESSFFYGLTWDIELMVASIGSLLYVRRWTVRFQEVVTIPNFPEQSQKLENEASGVDCWVRQETGTSASKFDYRYRSENSNTLNYYCWRVYQTIET